MWRWWCVCVHVAVVVVYRHVVVVCVFDRMVEVCMCIRYVCTTGMRRTSSTRTLRLHPGQNGICTDVVEKIQSQNVQKLGYVYHDTKWPKSLSSMEDPVVPLERNLYGHLLAGLLWEKQFEKVMLEHGWE